MKVRLFDAHCDTAYELWQRGEDLARSTCHIDLEKAAELGAYAQIFAFCSCAGLPGVPCAETLLREPLAYLRAQVQQHAARIAFAAAPDEAEALTAQGKIAALLSVEGPETIGCNPAALEALRRDGFVMTTLTWNADNALAGKHGSDRGLTARGRDFVSEAQRLGLAVDVSHLSEAAFWDLVKVTRKPILASHSNCRALRDHTRNLTDDQLRAIADTDGAVGLNLYVPFLGEAANFTTLERHLEHLLRLCGEGRVMLGGDLDGCDKLPEGFPDLRGYPRFYAYLRGRGYDAALLDRIFFDNLLQLLKREVP